MKKPAITSLAIGDNYLRNSIALMLSCRNFLNDKADYVVFYLYADLYLFQKHDWIVFEKIEEIFPIENRFSARRYKSVPLTHKKYLDRIVLYFDADVLVFKDNSIIYSD